MDHVCTLCSVSFDTESKYKAFPVCNACYQEAFDLDMTVARQLRWEEPNHIVDSIWLGGEGSTLDAVWLQRHGITRILTVAAHMDRMSKHEGILYMQIDVDDDPNEDLATHWDAAFDFLNNSSNQSCNSEQQQQKQQDHHGDGVLVHCVSGISRSGATVIMYVMRKHGVSYDEALALVRQKRPQVSPNSGFQKQLRRLEATLQQQQQAANTESSKR